MERISITRMKANLASYMRRVKQGESFKVTDHGRVVAVLEPLGWDPNEDEALTALVLNGLARPPKWVLNVDNLAVRLTSRRTEFIDPGRAQRKSR